MENTCKLAPIADLFHANPYNTQLFYPFKESFISKAFTGHTLTPELQLQHYCEVARQIAQAIDHLPLQTDCTLPAEKVLGNNTRILAHLIVVNYLEQNDLHSDEAATNYINRVYQAADQCFDLLTEQLQKGRPLAEIYTKNPVREEIDVKAGFTKAVVLENQPEVRKIVEQIFSKPLKLVCHRQREVYAYLSLESAALVNDTQNALYQNLKFYFENPEQTVIAYPHQSEHGSIYGSLFEQREFIKLLEELTDQAIKQYLKENQLNTHEEIVPAMRSEKVKLIEQNTEKKLSENIQKIVKEQKEIRLKPEQTEIAYVQDHYPLQAIVKEVVERKAVEELRNLVHQQAKNDSEAKAPTIRFPRITYFAVPRQGKYVTAQFAVEMLEGKNERLVHLINILNIGIRRFVNQYHEEQQLDQLKGKFKVTKVN